METKKLTKIIVLLVLVSAMAFSMSAQITYTSGTLVVGSPTSSPMPGVISLFNTPTLRYENAQNFLRFDLTGSYPAICGYNQYVGICCTRPM